MTLLSNGNVTWHTYLRVGLIRAIVHAQVRIVTLEDEISTKTGPDSVTHLSIPA